jgi:hypothetical protein
MTITTLYKITNIINNMCYYGIVYAKGKTIYDRFNDHMTGIVVSGKSPSNKGWMFYNDYTIISQLFLSLPQVITYET